MSRRSHSRGIAVVSIGDGSVSIGIGSARKGVLELAVHERRDLPLEERSEEQRVSALMHHLAEAGAKALARHAEAKGQPVGEVHCVLRAPWTKVTFSNAGEEFKTDQRITDALVGNYARVALEKSGGRKNDYLEARLTRVTLNGYPTTKPVGKYAHQIEVVALVSRCEPSMRAAAHSALGSVFSGIEPSFYAGASAILEALTQAGIDIHECVAVDVAEEGTDAIVIRQGAPESDGYLGEGVRSILQRANPAATPDSILAALRLMAREQCSDKTCAEIEAGFAKMEPDLAHSFGEFFATLGSPTRLPNKIVLIAPPDLAPWLSRFFGRIDFTQFTRTLQPFEVAVPTFGIPSEVKNDIPDLDLSVAAALINKQLSPV